MSDFDEWVGRTQTVTDTLDLARSNALSVTLGGSGDRRVGDALPLLHHWLYFWDVKPPAGLGPDGHPARGGFLPPVSLPRRMWAGGRLEFHKPLLLGAELSKTSTIMSVTEKSGRSGTLVFVTLKHELATGDGIAVTEEQDLVYREPAAESLPMPVGQAAPEAAWLETIEPNPVLLFRYSALTMNGHLIHYDRKYAIEQESYPALVVQGPLQATMLIGLAERNLDAPITGFSFRGQQPAVGGVPLHVCGDPEGNGAQMWTQQGDAKNMVATVTTGDGK